MKKSILLLFLFPVLLQAQFDTLYRSVNIGQVFTDNFARSSVGNNYTPSGTASWTCDTTKLITSGGTGVFTNLLKRTVNATCLEKYTITVDFRITSVPSSTSYGLGVGIFSSNVSDRRSFCISASTATGTYSGKTFIYTGSGTAPSFSLRKTSVSRLVINQNDSLRLIVTRDKNVLSWTFYNLRLGTSLSDSYTFSYAYIAAPIVPHNTGYFTLYSQGGTLAITKWDVQSTAQKNVRTLYVSHSIGYGIFAGTLQGRWINQLATDSTSYTVDCGPSDRSSEVLNKISELIAINPKYAVLDFLGNDISSSVPIATAEANYASIVAQLKAAGITVIHCFASPRNATNMTTINAWILATYGGTDIVVQNTFYDLTTTPGTTTDLKIAYDSGDHAHENAAGHTAYANAIYQVAPYLRR